MGSLYSDYNQIAQVYDATRVPVGLDFIGQLIKPDFNILDAGCGTGNYLRKFAPLVNKMTGIDFSEEMLNHAKRKLPDNVNVELIQGSLLEPLSFDDNTFDMVLINQVLHHLDGDYDNYPNAQKFLLEVQRVLKPSGIICINTCVPEQMNGFWFLDLIPRIKEEFGKRYMNLQKLGQILSGVGFMNQFRAVAFPEPLQGVKYFNMLGPLDDIWRLADSKWQLATQEEIAGAQNRLVELLKEGKLGAYFDEQDKYRREKGQTMFIVGQKGLSIPRGEKTNSDTVKVI